MHILKKIALAALVSSALVPGFVADKAMAAKTALTMGMVLEPPHLDPTAGNPPRLTRSSMPIFLKD